MKGEREEEEEEERRGDGASFGTTTCIKKTVHRSRSWFSPWWFPVCFNRLQAVGDGRLKEGGGRSKPK